MIRSMSVERDSAVTALTTQLAADLAGAADGRAVLAVVLRFADDRSGLMRANASRATAGYLGSVADGMQRLATELDEAARAAWGVLAPHVPQPPQGPVIDDRDLAAHEEADAAREANHRAVDRISAEADKRRRERRRG